MITRILLLSAAGAAGTLCRYGLAGLVHRFAGAGFPWGTLAVNITGCFLAGAGWAFFESRWPAAGQARIVVMIGFMGAFTTFSSYILETQQLMRAAEWLPAAGNFLLQNGLGFLALLCGVSLIRWI
ncbi:CrcB protein [Desulfosalsimonas propionicica]|uniref:Fluoride-specific ion channel FluC n=1 Tax=Desulfosalsimonas propionicica TaxID=332175 RepID=A0A7W0C8A5_9BACT|nr:CrcB family protein [Desulfosalsimonas propionicica]MBA2880930.1 CrcB protein [Desulfosalsimonas propionicica]